MDLNIDVNMDVKGNVVVKRELSPVEKNKKGKLVHKNQRVIIVNIYKKLRRENPEAKKAVIVEEVTKSSGIGSRTIWKILNDYERKGIIDSPVNKKTRSTVEDKVNESDKNAIRRKVHQFYFEGVLPTAAKVLISVNEDPELPNFKRTTFSQLLQKLNFKYDKRNSVLMESEDIILWRRRYIRDIRKYRAEGRTIYFLDETWVNVGDVSGKACMDKSIKSSNLLTGPKNPSSKGKRLIALHIGTEKGFVPGGLLCFESKKNSADYHDEMSSDTFLEWFQQILPSLDENSVIVMDNAPYHCIKMENIPTSAWSKNDVIDWLNEKEIKVDFSMLKVELLEIVGTQKEKCNSYIVDEEAKKQNKIVLRLPPHHSELNPIELVWSMVKGYVNSNNQSFKLADVKKLLEKGVERVTPDKWSNFVTHSIKEENRLWQLDEMADSMVDKVEPVFIKVEDEFLQEDFYEECY